MNMQSVSRQIRKSPDQGRQEFSGLLSLPPGLLVVGFQLRKKAQSIRQMNNRRIQQTIASCIALIALWAFFERLTGSASLPRMPDRSLDMSLGMMLNTSLLFLLTAFCLWPAAGTAPAWRDQAGKLGACLMIVLSGAILLQHASGLDFGIDQAWWDQPDNSRHPGRIPVNTSIAFLLTGLSLLALRRAAPGRLLSWLIITMVYAVLGIGLSAGLSASLDLDAMYRLNSYSQMAAVTAVAMSLTGIGLWLRLHQILQTHQPGQAPDQDITRTSVLVLTIVALVTGLTGFVVLKQGFDQSMSDTYLRSARNNAAAFSNTIEQQLLLNSLIASRPVLRNSLASLKNDPRDRSALHLVEEAISSFLPSGLSGVQILDASDRVISTSGSMADAEVSVPLLHPNLKATLLWKEGFILSTQQAVTSNGSAVGTLVIEQRLPVLTGMLREAEQTSPSTDVVVCGRKQDSAVCFPSRFYQTNLHIPLQKDGKPNMAIARALLGQQGVMTYRDLREVSVLSGYAPVGQLGLGLVIKTDTVELYTPIRDRLHLLLGLLAALVAAGTLILRARVHPLARQLVAKQERMQSLLNGTHEAFVEIDSKGCITDWNTQAERLFGWLRHEVMGKPMAGIIIPPAMRSMHDRAIGLQLGAGASGASGASPSLGKRREMSALHRDGSEFPIEITVSAMNSGSGSEPGFIAFMHDISERKASEQKILSSQHRLHAITDNLPVLISYIDRAHLFRFANATYESWLGMAPDKIMGASMEDILGSKVYQEQLPYIEQALAGNRVEFDTDVLMQGATRHLHNTFIPDFAADGSVAGIYAMNADVTALMQSKRRIRTITDNLPARIAYIDADERFRFCNRLYQTIAGIDADNMLGRTMREVFGEEAYSHLAPQVAAVLEGEAVFFERFAQKRGIGKYLDYAYIPEKDADGRVLGFYSMVTDVTARKNADIAREKEHELLEAILQTVDVGVVACDEHGALSLSNRAIRQFYGLPPHEVSAADWPDYYRLYHADGQTPMQDKDVPLYRALKGEQGNLDELVIVSAAGVARKIAASGRQLINKKGEKLGAVVVMSDITERRRIQDSLLASESRLRRLMNSSLIGIIQSDESGCLNEANDVFFQFSGYSREALLAGKLNWLEMTSSNHHERQQQAIDELRSQGTATPFESELIRRDGTLAPVFIGIAHLEGSDHEWVSFVLDLTEQRRLDRIKSEFISVVSHELRTPLTSIRGSLGLLEGGITGILPPQALHLVKIAHKNSERLVGLVNDILDMEKLEVGAIRLATEPHDLVTLVSQSMEANATYAESFQVAYEFVSPPPHAWVMGDADRIMQALANLLSNAAKFSPPDDKVQIRISTGAKCFKLEVEDHGAGIPPAFRERIFGKFAQAESNDTRQHGGTGLGLHITKTLIEKMGGEIGFTLRQDQGQGQGQDQGQGTIFWFTLPATDSAQDSDAPQHRGAQS